MEQEIKDEIKRLEGRISRLESQFISDLLDEDLVRDDEDITGENRPDGVEAQPGDYDY